ISSGPIGQYETSSLTMSHSAVPRLFTKTLETLNMRTMYAVIRSALSRVPYLVIVSSGSRVGVPVTALQTWFVASSSPFFSLDEDVNSEASQLSSLKDSQ